MPGSWPLAIASLTATALVVALPLGRSEFTGIMWLWLLALAGVLQRREAFGAGHRQRRRPGAVDQRLDRVGGGRQRERGGAAAGGVAETESGDFVPWSVYCGG